MTDTYPEIRHDASLTPEEVHRLLGSQRLVARRLEQLTDKSFVTDLLLTGSADATGTGALLIESDEGLYAGESTDVEEIGPGGAYPLAQDAEVGATLVAMRKRGFDGELTDERIARSPRDELRRKLTRMANRMIKDFDTIGMATILSKVTATKAASAAWTTGAIIIQDVLTAQAQVEELEMGYRPDVVVLKPSQYAKVSSLLIAANVLPREQGNPLLSGAISFSYLGLTWVKTMYSATTDPMLVDRANLGGIGTENIKSPGYARTASGIEVKTWRPSGNDDNDLWRVRTRRIALPYVTGPASGLRITGTAI